MFTFEFDYHDWLSQFYSEWRQNFKISDNFQDLLSAKVRVSNSGQNLKMTKTS